MPQLDGRTVYERAQAGRNLYGGSARRVDSSRRRLFTPHADNPSRLHLCPICQWAVDQDHAEALATHANWTPTLSLSHPPAGLAPECDAQEAAMGAGFALV